MFLSSLAMAWLLAQAPAPADVVAMTRHNFAIPIVIDAKRQAQIKQLILFVSDDEGKSWNQVAAATPDKTSFPFNAPKDGTYWFSVGVVDQQGKQTPTSPYDTQPAQKVLVDTEKPVIKINSAERQGDEAVVNWEIQEEHPDLATLKMEYKLSDAPALDPWTAVPLNGAALRAETRFRLTGQAGVTVRLEVKDKAGNVGNAEKTIGAGATPFTAPAPLISATGTGAGTIAGSVQPPPTVTTLSGTSTTTAERPPAVVPPNPIGRSEPPPPQYTPPATYQPPPSYAPASGGSEGTRVVAFSDPAGQTAGAAPTPPTSYAPLPPLQVINDPQLTLEYEVTQFGPSGVSKVELWITKDDGRTWQYLTDDPDCKSPITATLPGEGVYGLRLVMQSGLGMSKGPPIAGELPELRIEVDTTPPLVKLFEPRPDPAKRDTLIISWSASDRNLHSKPITLEYAERPEGPWLPIATDLPNTGAYSWQLPPKIPYRVHLRAIAIDTAGNRNAAETREPIPVDLTKPSGRLLGIVPVVRRPS